MTALLRFSAFALILSLTACAGDTPPATVDSKAEVLQPDKAVMPADQTRGTANANPDKVAEERMEEPNIRTESAQTQLKNEVKKEDIRVQKAAVNAEQPATSSPASSTSTAPAAAAAKTADEAEKAPEKPAESTAPAQGPPSHSAWNALLNTYVNSNGLVNYAGMKQHEKALDAYLNTLAASIPQKTWSTDTKLAYWLNAYNAFTVKLIMDNYPLQSITDLDGGEPWKRKWIVLENRKYSLNQIEHEIIRPQFKDPRIHFAVVCAAVSCPPLANEAFTTLNVNSLLDARTRKFINNRRYNETGSNPKVSKIFEWYAEDFGNVKMYLNKYLKEPIPADATIGYMEYDWSLNEQ